MSLPYNVQPSNAVATDNIEGARVLRSIHPREGRGYTYGNEDIQTYLDEAIEMDDTRDVYEEFIDNDGPEDNPKFLDELQVENNVDACPNPMKVVVAIYGDFDESYTELPQFLVALKDANPTTVTQLKCDSRGVSGTCTFNCAFWAFGLCIEGFKHCRPVISIDATHLYGKYKGKLLIAMATDANNEVYPLAFAVVKSESKETWGWFLACLTRFVTDRTNLCIISDRHSGIKACFDDTSMTWLQPPMAHHRYCLHHVARNVNTKRKILKLKNLVWRVASVNQVKKFEATLELIRNVKPAAYKYLEAENKQKWTLAHDGGHQCRAMTTNLSECFNGVLKGARSLPITAIVRFTFFKVKSYFDARRNLTLDQLEAGQEWCKYAMDKFEKNQAKAKDHMVTRMCTQARLYQVDTPGNPLSNKGRQHMHTVDLQDMTCTCGKWEAYKIPCSHVIAICAKYKHDEQQFIDPCYSVTHGYHSYEPVFQLLKDRLAWLDPGETRLVMPNSRLIRNKGQPKSIRIRNEMDEDDRSCRAPYGLRMDQSQDVGCVAKRGITVEHVLLKMRSQQWSCIIGKASIS
ncbi:hypothetical protein SO802_012548 [Lithocarpus litseifolius]|uniref:SWIM-type domain-containing protein n=1 Tax=Lithocarpus litseifolius TaxID=425828 RepID=A0AAW2D327_9ROSI